MQARCIRTGQAQTKHLLFDSRLIDPHLVDVSVRPTLAQARYYKPTSAPSVLATTPSKSTLPRTLARQMHSPWASTVG